MDINLNKNMNSSVSVFTITLKLVQPAKGAGGDKYQVSPSTKESFFYIPQNISRDTATKMASESLTLTISPDSAAGEIAFSLFKQGKTGDDRYTSEDQTVWKGDIYLPHSYRNANGKIYVTVLR
jgi:hypothetical protein